jgi:tRNA(Ile)-lysidine synthetase-like protein
MLRFRKQTVRRLQHLQDRAKLEATDDILEFEPFLADETNIMQQKLVIATEQFLRKHWFSLPYQNTITLPLLSESVSGSESMSTGGKKPKTVANILLISLSGGVDSMVISKILHLIKRQQPSLNIVAIVAVHIDYANRPESGREAAYVEEWSRQLQIDCRVRVVNEVTRGITDRDAYEKIARNIRYGTYQECIEDARNGRYLPQDFLEAHAGESVEIRVSGMMFGHHLGDVQENIISNVMRGSSPLYLSGMTETSVTNGVQVWRPLLSYVKEDIYAFSHAYGVPYFKDSTPSWSTRGKLRRQLIPLLLEVYGAGCLTNLSNLAHESDQTRELVHSNLYAPFLNSVRRFPCGLSVNILAYRHQSQCFWREVLKLLMHSMGMSLIRDKAVGNFTERIQRQASQKKLPHMQGKKTKGVDSEADSANDNPHRLQYGWLELRKGFHTFLTIEGDLVIFQDGVLRKNLVVYNVITSKNQSVQRQPSATTSKTSADAGVAINPKEMMNVYLRDMLQHIVHVDACLPVSVVECSPGALPVSFVPMESVPGLIQKEYPDLNAKVSAATGTSTTSLELVYGPWAISMEYLGAVSSSTNPLFGSTPQAHKRPPLPFIGDMLPGTFHYDAHWPLSAGQESLSCVFLKDVIEYLEAYRQATTSSVQELFRVDDDDIVASSAASVASSIASEMTHSSLLKQSLKSLSVDFRFMDVRLRDGLPLLIPFHPSVTSSDSNSMAHLRFVYRYQGRRADEHGSTGCEVH